jgi:hypothetical protein
LTKVPLKEPIVRSSLGYSVSAIAIMLTVAPMVGAQQRVDNLSRPAPIGDPASATAMFPLSVAEVAPLPSEPDRYRVLAHRIDSISDYASRLAGPVELRDAIAQTTSRLVFISQIEHRFGLGGSPSTFAGAHSPYGSGDWLNFVTLAGFTGLARNSFLDPGGSDDTVLGSLRTAGQWAGVAAAAGGASWLISNLTRRSMCLSRLSCRRPTTEHQSR